MRLQVRRAHIKAALAMSRYPSAEALAHDINIGHSTWSRLLSPKAQRVDLAILGRVMHALGLTLEDTLELVSTENVTPNTEN